MKCQRNGKVVRGGWVALVLGLTLGLLPQRAWAAFPLVADGRALVEVVLPAEPRPVERFAADELIWQVQQATGVQLPLVSEAGLAAAADRPRVWVGHTGHARAQGIDPQALPPSGYLVRASDEGLILIGHDTDGSVEALTTETGTLYAVCDFLERELAVRWLWPGREGSSVPARSVVRAGRGEVRGAPAFESARLRSVPVTWVRLAGRVRFAPQNVTTGHEFTRWRERYGQQYPEWFALDASGTRRIDRVSSMCVSNPAFHDQILRLWQEERAANPDAPLAVRLGENDTPGVCQCPNCLAWDGPDERFSFADPRQVQDRNVGHRYARFYREVWEKARQIDPQVRVVGFAYSNYVYAPVGLPLDANIVIVQVPPSKYPSTAAMRAEIDTNLDRWIATGASLVYRPNIFSGYVMPQSYVTEYYDEFRKLWSSGRLLAVDVDGPNASFAMQGPMLYVMARLLARPEAALEELLAEYEAGFGAASDTVASYWRYWEGYVQRHAESFEELPKNRNKLRFERFFGFQEAFYAHEIFPVEAFEPARALLERAEQQVADRPGELARVRFLRAGLEHAVLCSEACRLFADPAAGTAARLAAMNAVQRFRETALPPHAASLRLATANGRNESVAWTFSDFDPEWMLQLPIAWKGQVDPQEAGVDAGFAQMDFGDGAWADVLTDRHLENQGISDYRFAWYRLRIEIPEKFRGKRTVLELGAVDESCRLWINGQPAGVFTYDPAINPESWKEPLSFDITPHLASDGTLQIALRVENRVGGGGLWRPSLLKFFERDGAVVMDDAYFQQHLPGVRGYGQVAFLQPQMDGASVARFVSHPSVQAKPQRDYGVTLPLPFDFVAGRRFEVSAEMKLSGRTAGYFSVVLEQRSMGHRSLGYTHLRLARDTDWVRLQEEVVVHPEARSLRVIFYGKELNEGHEALVRQVRVRPVG